jgi:hypothetical protein
MCQVHVCVMWLTFNKWDKQTKQFRAICVEFFLYAHIIDDYMYIHKTCMQISVLKI